MQIITWNQLSATEQHSLLQRPSQQQADQLHAHTLAILNAVKQRGDEALFELTKTYDKATLTSLKINAEQIAAAEQHISPVRCEALKTAITRIKTYHQHHMPKNCIVDTQDGIRCERLIRPIQRVGLYVPGGSAPLVSTLMMLALPAQLADCPVRILCTPPNAAGQVDPHLLATAKWCGIETIYLLGGAQAIGAMAYGTQTVPKVDKIFGPGNAWVTAAKLLVSQDPSGASIDLPAGPSELMVIADDKARPDYIAADLLSQAEHGVDSQVLLVTDSESLARSVLAALDVQLAQLERKNIAAQALTHSHILVVDTIEQAIEISNQYAPEHLSLQLTDYKNHQDQIQCAGAVFLGSYTPETMGDYLNGSNHVLPTYGFARSYSGLNVSDFMTFISFQEVSQAGLNQLGPIASILAALEGLGAHQNAVDIRLQQADEVCDEF